MRLMEAGQMSLERATVSQLVEDVFFSTLELRGGGGAHAIDVLTTGVGMVATAAWCSRVLAKQDYDLALNVGVCGSFDTAKIGTAVGGGAGAPGVCGWLTLMLLTDPAEVPVLVI